MPQCLSRQRPFQHQRVALAALMACLNAPHAWAQATTPPEPAEAHTLPTVVVHPTPSRQVPTGVAGLGELESWATPVQATRFDQTEMANAQIKRLADVVKLDASTTDAYNTTGYWDYLSIRGFTLDNASNYLREGLPINAETRIALDNKAGVELLKGTSGMQAGISAPGGLVNLLVKRPEGHFRQFELAFTGGSSVRTSVDLGEQFGEHQQFGLRVNVATERLDPDVQAATGQRHLAAVAGQWRINAQSTVDIELEHSRHRQPSVPGFSAFGSRLPSANSIDPAINLNQQTWTLPVDMTGNTGSTRWQQQWDKDWTSTISYGEQHLRSDDRAAFPYGCGGDNCDRFYDDGSFDLYDFRSEDERRTTKALSARLNGKAQWLGWQHDLSMGLLRSTYRKDVSSGYYTYVNPLGEDVISVNNPSAPYDDKGNVAPDYDQADLLEHSTQWTLQDAIAFNDQWRGWFGVRHSRFARTSTPTNGDASTSFPQNITTRWVALGYQVAPQAQWYASWGEGAEVMTADHSPDIANPGQVMPAVKSRQMEIGYKQQMGSHHWGVNAFRITRPEMAEVALQDDSDQSRYQLDGHSSHQGLEGYWQWEQGPWSSAASAMFIHARRHGSSNGFNGLSPTNVPRYTVKWSGSYQLPARLTAGLRTTTSMDVVHEGPRWADQANTLRVAAWTRLDAGVQATQRLHDQSITWRLGVTNLLNTRAWRESPNSFGHIWLFPMQARTWTASLQLNF